MSYTYICLNKRHCMNFLTNSGNPHNIGINWENLWNVELCCNFIHVIVKTSKYSKIIHNTR